MIKLVLWQSPHSVAFERVVSLQMITVPVYILQYSSLCGQSLNLYFKCPHMARTGVVEHNDVRICAGEEARSQNIGEPDLKMHVKPRVHLCFVTVWCNAQ